MTKTKLINRARVFVASGAVLSVLIGTAVTAPVAGALTVPAGWTFAAQNDGIGHRGRSRWRPFLRRLLEHGQRRRLGDGRVRPRTSRRPLQQRRGLRLQPERDKRTCSTSPIVPNTDFYDNYDHNIVNNAGQRVRRRCTSPVLRRRRSPPSRLRPRRRRLTTPTRPVATEGANGMGHRPGAIFGSEVRPQQPRRHGLLRPVEQGIASDAIVGLSFSPVPPASNPDHITVQDPANGVTIDYSNGSNGAECGHDPTRRGGCSATRPPIPLPSPPGTSWYQAEGLPNPPSPDQPIVLWGIQNKSGTGATWYTFAGCGTGDGRIATDHLMNENDAQQISQFAAQNPTGSISLNTTSCPANTTVGGEACGPNGTTGAPVASATMDNCGGTGPGSGLGTATWTAANEQCIYQEVADSLFPMSYGYFASHPFTASITLPTAAAGSSPNYIYGSNYQVKGTAGTIGGAAVSGSDLGQLTAVPDDPRANNVNAVQTGRDLWADYLSDHVRASAAGFVNWFCDQGQHVEPKGFDNTTGLPYDTEITNAITAWGWGRLNCDAEPSGNGSYGPAVTTAVIDPGPPNNE